MDALQRYLRTEAWRHAEEAAGAPRRDVAIEARAIAAGPDFQSRIHARAAAFLADSDGAAALTRLARRIATARGALLLGAFILGLGVTRVFPSADGASVNVVTVLGVLLLPNLVSLLLWLFGLVVEVMLRVRRAIRGDLESATTLPIAWLSAAGWLGTRCAHALHWLVPRGAASGAALQAWTGYLLRTGGGRAGIGLFAHLLWLALLAGAFAGASGWLVLRQLDFQWGSTLLDAEQVTNALVVVGRPLAACGVAIPTEHEILASRFGTAGAAPGELRREWGLYVLAALGVYGLLPRLFAVCVAWGLWRRRTRQLTLDETAPGYARLRPWLVPVPSGHVIDDDRAPPAGVTGTPAAQDAPLPAGAWLSLERPFVPAATPLHDYGAITDRAGQQAVLAALTGTAWPALIVQAGLTTTPDRGLGRFLAALAATARCPVYLRIVDEPAAAPWPVQDYQERLTDWTALAARAGISAQHLRLPVRMTP